MSCEWIDKALGSIYQDIIKLQNQAASCSDEVQKESLLNTIGRLQYAVSCYSRWINQDQTRNLQEQ